MVNFNDITTVVKFVTENYKDVKFNNGVRNRGIFFTMIFNNSYGVDIVSGPYTYGGKDGLYELAIIRGTLEEYSLVYDTPITNDVLGWLTIEEALEYALEVKELDSAE